MAAIKPLVMDPDRPAWEQQPGERDEAWDQFRTYRDLGRARRSLPEAAKALGLSYGHTKTLASARRWVQRATAYYRWLDEIAEAEWVEARKKAMADDAKLLRIVIGAAAQRLATVDPAKLTVTEATRLMDLGLRHRRALFGNPTDVIAITGPQGDALTVQLQDFEQLPEEQRAVKLKELAASAARRAHALAEADEESDDA
ncbi:hypothetical protein [Streptacidiphilus cavernicola]|uniref:Terminase small subunit n=1 Tax=Streptacidiphilus cavernicola TaxID=3342716 RepID=A0ABV6VYQ9_9ACTN